MPNKHAAIKDLRKSRKRLERNVRMKTHVKALSSKLQELLKEGKRTEAVEMTKRLQQAVDKAAKNHVFHPNKSARKLSRAHRQLAATK